ncbi:MAG TPA: ferric reductase-like transmembrane domain-containing protein [Dermatophilaceae bacterium]|nr:ferric reductase-like transmembrane domain-containing protein [Dermatophilaceae bacterium]
MTGPALWYLNRGTGVVLLVLYTATVLLGVLARSGSGPGPRWWPRFATQGLHRSLTLLSTLLLAAHVTSAVLDDYVDIDWRDAILPVGGSYRPLYLGAGALALDLLLVIVVTSLLRKRIPDRAWRWLHLLAYPSWLASVVHTIGIATDIRAPWLVWSLVGCVGMVVFAAVLRFHRRGEAVPSR